MEALSMRLICNCLKAGLDFSRHKTTTCGNKQGRQSECLGNGKWSTPQKVTNLRPLTSRKVGST
eukprot:scaffold141998_cov41-Prasinocladus_malaysianus.AAC.1